MYNQIPYMMNYPYPNLVGASSGSKISSLLGKINFSSILTNAQKTLSVVNQAIPLYHQVKPVVSNLRTIGRISKEFTKINNTNTYNNANNNFSTNETINNKDKVVYETIPTPTFFL